MLFDIVHASTFRVRASVMIAAGELLKKVLPEVMSTAGFDQIVTVLEVGSKDAKFHQVRLRAASALQDFVGRLSRDNSGTGSLCEKLSSGSVVRISVMLAA